MASVLGTVIVCGMGAYGMSKFRYPGSRLLFSLVVAALMFSPQVTQIPTYMVVSGMHLTNTYWALILHKLSTAMYLFLDVYKRQDDTSSASRPDWYPPPLPGYRRSWRSHRC